MTTVFISGSITISRLDPNVIDRLNNIVASKFHVIVGDAKGVDSTIQKYLGDCGVPNVLIYCSGDEPRNNFGNWSVKRVQSTASPGSREFFTAKDKSMVEDCDYGFLIWDAKSAGTLNNAIELTTKRKLALIYLNKVKTFLTIRRPSDIQDLLRFMHPLAIQKANDKIGLLKKLDELTNAHANLFNEDSLEKIVSQQIGNCD
jgi:hypothetical protein